MKTDNMFEETKIKMVMKLKRLSRSEAIKEIARRGAARRADAKKRRPAERRGSRVDPERALGPHDAEEFFMELPQP